MQSIQWSNARCIRSARASQRGRSGLAEADEVGVGRGVVLVLLRIYRDVEALPLEAFLDELPR